MCYYRDITFTLNPEEIIPPGATYDWNFGVGAVPATANTEGPHTVQYTSAGNKVVTCTVEYQGIIGFNTYNITIVSCLGNITGAILTDGGATGVQGVNIRLYPDVNLDGVSDGGAPIRSVNSNSSGIYSMASLVPGQYVIVLTLPPGYTLVSGIDTTVDSIPDVGIDLSPSDLVIPVTIRPQEIDSDNIFIIELI